jgi:subtilisin family serine protease
MRHASYVLRAAGVVCFVIFIGIAAAAEAQEVSYTDKLFGKTIVLSPEANQVAVKFAADRGLSEMEVVGERLGLRLSTPGLERLRYGVFSLPEGASTGAVTDMLKREASVVGVLPVYRDQEGYERYVDPESFTVQFRDGVDGQGAQEILDRWGCKIVFDHWTPGFYTVSVPEGMTVFEAVRTFMASEQVEFVEPLYYGFDDWAGDTYLEDSWHLRNTGQEEGYTPGNAINAFEAWNLTYGSSDVVLVIVDTGIELDHPDLEENILDRDGEDWDFEDPYSEIPSDDIGHGTSVSGIAAAVMNEVGVRGVAPGVMIMPLKTGSTGGEVATRADAINYAVSRAGDFDGMVISCSWYTNGDVTSVHRAILHAHDAGIACFFAAGNDNLSTLCYPAQYRETIAVGAMAPCDGLRKSPTTCDGEDFWGSNYGDSLDVAAPGVHIYTTDMDSGNGYNPGGTAYDDDLPSPYNYTKYFYGTSSSTPQAAAVAALMLSLDSSLEVEDIRSILHNSARKVGGYDYDWDLSRPGHSRELGYGLVDAYGALVGVKYNAELVREVELTEDTSWPTSSFFSNVFIAGDVSVAEECTLTVSPGTVVYCEADSAIQVAVAGGLQCQGSEENPITFTSAADTAVAGDWDGVETYPDAGALLLEHCVVEYAEIGVWIRNGSEHPSTIRDCVFRENETAHLDIFCDGDIEVKNCHFDVDSPYGILITNTSSPSSTVIDSCVIVGTANATHGISVAAGGPTLSGNTISGLSFGSGIRTNVAASPTITDNEILNCKYGIRCEGSSEASIGEEGDVTNVAHCTSGIYTEDTSSPDVSGVEIDSCTVGIHTRDSSDPQVVSDNIIAHCNTGLYAMDSSEPYVRNTVFDTCETYGARVTFAADPNLGTWGDAGNNSFYPPTYGCPDYRHVMGTKTRAAGLDSVRAVLNWWGTHNPGSNCFAGWVDFTPWLNSDPCYAGDGGVQATETLHYGPALWQNYPNPFIGSTLIAYQVPNAGARVTLRVYDAMGRLVRVLVEGPQTAGLHQVAWAGRNGNGRAMPAGVYFYEIQIGSAFKATKKMGLVH